MSISVPGLIGAAIGLYLGWIDYKIVIGVLRGAAERRRQQTGKTGLYLRFEPQLRLVVLGVALVGFPLVGYFAASSLTG
ncbi:hypothetical protein [Stappia sp.]|jgi:hypothetical protein|uniref:hypothetical protein n=1 Tax=Stappia sp. TaxID=1870903 RepID=UPI003A9A03E1